METELRFDILAQPNDSTCGPTCLHGVYRFHGDHIALPTLIGEVPSLEQGGTLSVLLAVHALRRGYRATLHTYNLRVFDPTWFALPAAELRELLVRRARYKKQPKLRVDIEGYIRFLDLGGELRFDDMTPALVRRYLKRGTPILTGLSATYLYRDVREMPETGQDDAIRGDPVGHFVVLCGYDAESRSVLVADPLHPNPMACKQHYKVSVDRVICATLLGVLTYDANLLTIEPKRR